MTASWNLKLDRAERHLREVKREVAKFSDKHPYRARKMPRFRKDKRVWRYALEFTEQPDDKIAVVIGDVIHNVRSALDHLAVAAAPRKYRYYVSFPVFDKSPFDSNGNLLDSDNGKAWSRRTQGFPEFVMDLVKFVQPYCEPDAETHAFCKRVGIKPTDIHALSTLSRLENADKHRELITVANGLMDARADVSAHGRPLDSIEHPDFTHADAEIAKILFPKDVTIPPESEVEVKISGTAVVAIPIADYGVSRAPQMLDQLIALSRNIAELIEPYARS